MTSLATPPAARTHRRPAVSMSATTGNSSIARGATARASLSPRVASSIGQPYGRRTSLRNVSPPQLNGIAGWGETKEELLDSLRRESEEKERLALQLQIKDQTISELTTETDKLSTALNGAESRLSELYADQVRSEEEMSARIEVAEKLRTQVRELEREKREVQRRYNEQTATFEAERQAFYDNEQHLKSRIHSFTQARKERTPTIHTEYGSEAEQEEEPAAEAQQASQGPSPNPSSHDLNGPEEEQDPAEMTALKMELSTLSTSYASIQNTLQLLQTQMVDLKRVNRELQEENESYNILLTEKTLSGQFHVRTQVSIPVPEESESEEDDDDEGEDTSRSNSRSPLGTVDEVSEVDTLDDRPFDTETELQKSLDVDSDGDESAVSPHSGRRGRRRAGSVLKSSSPTRAESLADLPITGPGLDLAAELGRAENKDILDGNDIDARDRSVANGSKSNKRKKSNAATTKKNAGEEGIPTDLDTLRKEVKSLTDANKALSLYASKIIDRIIAQEGFEHVLAADYEKAPPPSPSPHTPAATTFEGLRAPSQQHRRPQSTLSGGWGSSSSADKSNAAASNPRTGKRRSLSFDWRSFSMFGGGGDKKDSPLKPLTLKTGVKPMARKLDTEEDEEDKRERERMIATMKLMGIEKPTVATPPPMQKSYSAPNANGTTTSSHSSSSSGSRFSFFRRGSQTTSEASSTAVPASPATPINLTEEALEQAEAENKLAALDAQERALSAEIAKGATTGYTEPQRRQRGSGRRSAGGSGSTVWSAGMSRSGEDGDD